MSSISASITEIVLGWDEHLHPVLRERIQLWVRKEEEKG
jgi:hypothetical protein